MKKRVAPIVGGIVGEPRVEGDAPEGAVPIPWFWMHGDEIRDGVAFRDGIEVLPTLYPASRLTIKTRVTPSEWEAIKAAIASDLDAAENWDLAEEIDPAHPQTAAMIQALRGAGRLTTPLYEIFAPPS